MRRRDLFANSQQGEVELERSQIPTGEQRRRWRWGGDGLDIIRSPRLGAKKNRWFNYSAGDRSGSGASGRFEH